MIKWVLDHHVYKENNRVWHVNEPFEMWLLNKLEELHAEHFYILPSSSDNTKEVIFKIVQ
jgi:hypothetical protein